MYSCVFLFICVHIYLLLVIRLFLSLIQIRVMDIRYGGSCLYLPSTKYIYIPAACHDVLFLLSLITYELPTNSLAQNFVNRSVKMEIATLVH